MRTQKDARYVVWKNKPATFQKTDKKRTVFHPIAGCVKKQKQEDIILTTPKRSWKEPLETKGKNLGLARIAVRF